MGVEGGSSLDAMIVEPELLGRDSFVPRRASGLAPDIVRGWVLIVLNGRAPPAGGAAFRAEAFARGRDGG